MSGTPLDWLAFVLAIPGWSLIHLAWQGALLGCVLELIFVAQRRSTPVDRERIAMAGLALFAIVFAATALEIAGDALALGPVDLIGAELHPGRIARSLGSLAPWIGIAWLLGVEFLLVRLAIGWARLSGIRHRARPLDDADAWHALERMAGRWNLRGPIELLVSSELGGPALVGWRRPAIVIPEHLLPDLTRETLDATIAHELAHLRRGDAFARRVQLVIGAVLFPHPIAHRLLGRLEREREQACDDLAVSVVGSSDYARALARIERLRAEPAPLALAAGGGPLMQRVRRLVAPTPVLAPLLARSITVAALVAIAVTARGSITMIGHHGPVLPPVRGLTVHRGHDWAHSARTAVPSGLTSAPRWKPVLHHHGGIPSGP